VLRGADTKLAVDGTAYFPNRLFRCQYIRLGMRTRRHLGVTSWRFAAPAGPHIHHASAALGILTSPLLTCLNNVSHHGPAHHTLHTPYTPAAAPLHHRCAQPAAPAFCSLAATHCPARAALTCTCRPRAHYTTCLPFRTFAHHYASNARCRATTRALPHLPLPARARTCHAYHTSFHYLARHACSVLGMFDVLDVRVL